jgi:aspartate/methionine/tyrosine aminotransferase
MKFSPLVERVAGEGADAWVIHFLARAAKERGEDVIILSIGDPDLETPGPVLERAIERLRNNDVRYTPPAGRDALRRAIAKEHSHRTGQPVVAANTIFLSGAQNALFTASLLVAGPGDEVLALEPLYPSYPATIKASGASLVRVPAPADNRFRIDLDALKRAITPRTRAFFFATPNNPSGGFLNEEELQTIGDLAEQHELWLVADEVYAGLAPGGRVPGLAARLPEQVITVSSLSKSHSMPGWRAGWLVGPQELVRHAENLAMCNLFGLPGFIQEAAITAFEVAEAAEKRVRDLCNARRDFVVQGLAGLKGIRCHVPQAGMFTLIDVRDTGLTGHDFSFGLFEAEGVAVLDGGAFGPGTQGFVRLCFATSEAELQQAIVRIRRYVTQLTR